MIAEDPVTSNPEHYRTIFENEHVRVLHYIDKPGERTTPHVHPNSVMVTLTDFHRRLSTAAGDRDIELAANHVFWLPAQRHAGENIGTTPTHTVLIELKGAAAGIVDEHVIGPSCCVTTHQIESLELGTPPIPFKLATEYVLNCSSSAKASERDASRLFALRAVFDFTSEVRGYSSRAALSTLIAFGPTPWRVAR